MTDCKHLAQRILILDAAAQTYIGDLRARFPTLTIETIGDPDRVADGLTRVRPHVVYSCKSAEMPGPCHRPAVLDANVEWLQVAGAGFEHLQPIDRRELVVTNSSGVLARFMGETVLGAIVMLNFGFNRYIEQARKMLWRPLEWSPLVGKRALIVVLGAIGIEVARHCQHLGMHVTGLRRRPELAPGFDRVIRHEDLHSALAESDLLCVHVPFTARTKDLIGEMAFMAMKPGIYIVNTSRGGVMNESALLDALRDGRVAGAHLDVFAREPLPADDPLWGAPNLVITPHCADSVTDYTRYFAMFFAENLARWLAGEPLHNRVDPSAGY